jgi:integrase
MIVVVDHIKTDKSSGVLIYRRKFPKDLIPYVPSGGPGGCGRAEFKKSLQAKTMSSPGAAARLQAAQDEFEELVRLAKLKRRAAQKRVTGTYDELDAPTVAYVAECYRVAELASDEARRWDPAARAKAAKATEIARAVGHDLPQVSESAEWTQSIRLANAAMRDAAREMRANGDEQGIVETWGDLALSMAAERSFVIEPLGGSHRSLCIAINDAAAVAHEEALRRLDGDMVPTPTLPELRKRQSSGSVRTGRTLRDLIEAFKADRADQWSISASRNFVPVERLMLEVLGEDFPLADIDRDRGRELFETVKKLPKGMGRTPGLKRLSVAKAINLGLPGLSPKSINGTYLSTMKAMFKFAVNEQWMVASPMLGLTVVDPVHAADKRDPFTVNQLNTIFSGAPWSPRDDAPRGKPLHYWGPLIALFHGMRRSEIAQLHVSDVMEVAGVQVILIKAGGGKRTKTKNARRMLPVHPELVQLGFLDYVGQRRAAGGVQLWEGERPNNTMQWGDGFSDWFSRLIKAHTFTGTRLGLHSFRHNFEDALREAGLHGSALGAELAGRTKGGDTSNNYGSGYPTRLLADAMAKIAYPGLVIRG